MLLAIANNLAFSPNLFHFWVNGFLIFSKFHSNSCHLYPKSIVHRWKNSNPPPPPPSPPPQATTPDPHLPSPYPKFLSTLPISTKT